MAVADEDLVGAGTSAAPLICDPRSWINRRVETIQLLTQEETRRQVSIDFTLDSDTQAALTTPHGVVVPISVLSKGPLRNFDLCDESGRSVPVLGRDDNSLLTHVAVLTTVLNRLATRPTSEAFRALVPDVRQVVATPPDEASNALLFFAGSVEQGESLRASVWMDDVCRELLYTTAFNYVLFAVLPTDGPARRVLKFSYGDDFDFALTKNGLQRFGPRELARRAWSPDRKAFQIQCPAATRAQSFHVEIAIPEELRVEHAEMGDLNRQVILGDVDDDVNRVSLYSGDLDADADVQVEVVVAPERVGVTTQAALTSCVVAALLWLGWASGLDGENPGAAISLLVAGAAVFSGVAAGQNEHILVRSIFAARRRWLASITISALASSASLAMEVPSATPTTVWLIAAAVATVAAARLTWSAIRAAF